MGWIFAGKQLKTPPFGDGEFLSGTRVLAALNKIGSSYLKKEFQRNGRRFLGEFTNSVLSTVAARSKIGQGLSCSWPAIIIDGSTARHCICLVFCWMGFWNGGGSKAVRLRLVGLNTSLCPRATTAGAVFNEEPPWRMWRPVVLLFRGWFLCPPASL